MYHVARTVLGLRPGQAVGLGTGAVEDVLRVFSKSPAIRALGVLGAAADIGISMGVAMPGDRLAQGIGSVSGQAVGLGGAYAGALIGQALLPIPILGGVAGAIIGGSISDMAARSAVIPIVRSAMEHGSRVGRLQMGKGYVDTDTAHTLRQRAAMEMSRSLLNARQYLGSEGSLYHE
jgi:hypothetical protein